MRCHLALLFALAAATPATAVTMNFDFGANTRQTNLPGWNDVFHDNGSPTPTLFVVKDSNDNPVPGVTLVETDEFYIVGQPSTGGTQAPLGDAAAFPLEALVDYYFGHSGPFGGGADNPSGGFKLTGLNQSLAYDFTFFSSRSASDNRETAYSVTGANVGSGALNASSNASEVLSINGILPDANSEISIVVSAGLNNDNGNGFFYVNLMQVSAIPEPATGLLLALAGGFAAFRRRRR